MEAIEIDLREECSPVRKRGDRTVLFESTKAIFRLHGVDDPSERKLVGTGDIHYYIIQSGKIYASSIMSRDGVPYVIPIGLRIVVQHKGTTILMETEADTSGILYDVSTIGPNGEKNISRRDRNFSFAWKFVSGERSGLILKTHERFQDAIRRQLFKFTNFFSHPLRPALEPFMRRRVPQRVKYAPPVDPCVIDFSKIPKPLLENEEFTRYLCALSSRRGADVIDHLNYGNLLCSLSRDSEALVVFEHGVEKKRYKRANKMIRTTYDQVAAKVGPVTAVAMNGDIAISGSKGRVFVWNVETETVVRQFAFHPGTVLDVAISPYSSVALTASDDETVYLWDLNNSSGIDEPIAAFRGHDDKVLAVAFFPDGRRAVSGSCDRSIIVWDIVERKALHTLRGHTSAVHAVAASERWIVSGSSDNTVRVWDGTSFAELRCFEGHTHYVTSVATGVGCVFSSSADKSVRVWSIETGCIETIISVHETEVATVIPVPDTNKVVSASVDGIVKVWEKESGEVLREIKLDSGNGIIAIDAKMRKMIYAQVAFFTF